MCNEMKRTRESLSLSVSFTGLICSVSRQGRSSDLDVPGIILFSCTMMNLTAYAKTINFVLLIQTNTEYYLRINLHSYLLHDVPCAKDDSKVRTK